MALTLRGRRWLILGATALLLGPLCYLGNARFTDPRGRCYQRWLRPDAGAYHHPLTGARWLCLADRDERLELPTGAVVTASDRGVCLSVTAPTTLSLEQLASVPEASGGHGEVGLTIDSGELAISTSLAPTLGCVSLEAGRYRVRFMRGEGEYRALLWRDRPRAEE